MRLDLLLRLGLFVQSDFLDAGTCRQVTAAVLLAASEPADVYDGREHRIDRDVRSAGYAQPDQSIRTAIQSRLDAARPAVGAHFGVELTRSEGVSFLVYDRGGFFRPHRDRVSPETSRRISAVVFLNEQSACPDGDSYSGGQLMLYGLVPEPPWSDIGFPVPAVPGLLIAFDATTLHEVTTVTGGRRVTAVDWFS